MAPADPNASPPVAGLWTKPAPGKLVGPGHSAGDLLEAYEWDVLECAEGVLRVGAHLPDRLGWQGTAHRAPLHLMRGDGKAVKRP